jgi:hypothetical protein
MSISPSPPTENAIQEWISVAEAQRRSGYSERRLRELMREGKVGVVRDGRGVLLEYASLLAYCAQATRRKPYPTRRK